MPNFAKDDLKANISVVYSFKTCCSTVTRYFDSVSDMKQFVMSLLGDGKLEEIRVNISEGFPVGRPHDLDKIDGRPYVPYKVDDKVKIVETEWNKERTGIVTEVHETAGLWCHFVRGKGANAWYHSNQLEEM